jgi:hypothetical protein
MRRLKSGRTDENPVMKQRSMAINRRLEKPKSKDRALY